MAEFKLGRIRFVWKDNWASGTTYYKDDVVRYGGKTYLCQIGHTANQDFYTDLNFVPTKWNLMTDGHEWKGDWSTGTYYKVNDLVRYGGLVYSCKTPHTSAATATLGLEADQDLPSETNSKWQVFAKGLDWKGNWTTSTRYKRGDLVKYGGYTYVCNTGHTSSSSATSGLEANQSFWDQFNQGLDYKGNWTASGTRYKINDIVKYGAGLWICVTQHTSTGAFSSDSANWNQFVEGFEFEDTWSSVTTYQPGDIVRYGGNQYVSKTIHTNQVPTVSASDWDLFAQGFKFTSDWSFNTEYKVGEVVRFGGYTYVATGDVTLRTVTVTQTNASTGIFTSGNTGNLVAGMAVKFSGTTFGDVSPTATYYIRTVVGATEFTISTTPGGALYLPAAGSGSMTATASTIPPNTAKWQQLNSGMNWRNLWTDDTEYQLGDVVRYGDNAYICIQTHRSEGDDGSTVRVQGGGAANSRPDLDTTGVYWNILVIGNETSVLNTRGDMVYYGGSGPTRLPIGIEGQVLAAGAEYPQWVTIGKTDHVYYVAPHGQDHPPPVHGLSIDKPFKSIRYACEWVEKGARNLNTKHLLEMNRVFIQREVTSWIDYQIANATVGSPWYNFDYDEYKCERDVGYIVDRLIHDVSHGGNLKMRAAAQTYLNALNEGPYSNESDENGTGVYSKLSTEGTNDVSAYNYMLDVIEAVLGNEPPAVVYQNVLEDSTAIASQYFALDRPAEPGVMTTIRSLVGIVTDALTAKDTSVIPAREVPNVLIRVSTGTYRETLPIIVPAYTCVIGDELRSTNAGPAGSLISIDDSFYTVNTFDRISEVVADVVAGNAVTPTSGNTVSQSMEWPFADALESSAVSQLVQVMKHQIDYRLGTMHTSSLSDPIGYDSGFENARDLLVANKRFLAAETLAYLQQSYPDLAYGKTKSRRDAGYIVDALIYDLTYGGNALSVKAGLAYFDGDDDSQPQIPASIEEATLNSLFFLKERAQTVALGVGFTPLQTEIVQVLGPAGSGAAVTAIGNNVEVVRTIIATGPQAVGTSVTLIDPTPVNGVNTTTALIAAYNALDAAKSTRSGPLDTSFVVGTGFNDAIRKFAIQSDGKIVAVGGFTSYNGTSINRIARLNTDGSLDTSFVVGTGFDAGLVYTVAIQSDGKIVVGGQFTAYNGTSINRIARLNTDGSLDTSFVVGTGFNSDVNAIAIQSDGKIVVGGNFTNYNGTARSRVAQLNSDGSLDTSFAVSTGFDTIVYDIAVQTDGKVIAGGIFTTYNGTSRNRIARLNTNGSLDTSFVVGTGFDNGVYALDIQPDGKIVAVGIFISYNGTSIRRIARLNTDGSLDTSFVVGTGLNDAVFSVAIQSDGKIVVGGQFTSYNGTTQNCITQLNSDGSRDTTFSIGTGFGTPYVYALAVQTDGKVLAGGSFISYNGTSISRIARLDLITGILPGVVDYINTNFPTLSYSEEKAARDAGIVLKAVGYDFMFNSNYQTIKAAHAYLRLSSQELFDQSTEIKQATLAALEYTRTRAIANVNGNSTAISRINSLMAIVYDIVYGGSNDGSICQTELRNRDYAALQLERNRNFIVAEVAAWIADTYPSYTYDQELCLRDVNTYIDALKYDLKWPGNYKSRYVARYYVNAVLGSYEEDMYYLRDGTGVRDMTLEGLNGDLTPPNEYGTSRVTAGAYCSLDPGWGPADFTTWILSRSPYIQGVTTFGNGCIGQKIDGALHNGGNDSMVSNDFTQVLSDGIGAWVANNGRAELVSVFTYYNHIGYLSTEGGRIRGTNGNNSYGDFGSVAEGFDQEEIPGTAIVDNVLQYRADVGYVFTNGNQMLHFEWNNAGVDYSEAEFVLTGGGLGAAAEVDEFRDDGVFEVRLQDLGDDSSGQFGGLNYLTNSNTAQGGTSTQITIAATDSEISSAYVGMKIYLTGGTGVGQYGIISTYNAGSKIATIVKETTGAPGWDHVVPGSAISSPDASTTYTIEPTLQFSAPEFTSEVTTLGVSGTWLDVIFGNTAAVYTMLTGNYTGLGEGAVWQVVRNGYKYNVTLVSGGTGYSRLEEITILGTSLGGETPLNDLVITITSVNSITGEITAFDQSGYGIGGRYVAVRSGGSVSNLYSNNGTTWSSSGIPGTVDCRAIAHGLLDDGSSIAKVSKFVITGNGNTAAHSVDGITWTQSTMPSSKNWASVAYGQGRFVAASASDNAIAISNDGEVWDITATTATGGTSCVAYGKGLFVATKTASGNTIYTSSNGGVTWTERTLPATAVWTSVTWGNNRFVAIANNSNSGAYSLDGITWTAMTIGSADGSSVAGYQKVKYGQGVFMATAWQSGVQDYSYVATSEDGIVWTVKGVAGARNGVTGYGPIAFGTPNRTGKWVVLTKDTGQYAAMIRTGARTRARAYVADTKIYAIRVIEPGSGYTVAPTITITDPNNTYEAPTLVRIGRGVLATPTFLNRGNQYVTGSAEINRDASDGYADFLQSGTFIAVRRLSKRPVAGSNVVFADIPGQTFKLVNILTFRGELDGSYTAFFQVSPEIANYQAPSDGSAVTTRIRYSQVRLTGHDFLDVGTGGFVSTNYPGLPTQDPIPANETQEGNGGRVFYTSTDQDGNFRVGGLFNVEQSTGIATLNADAFNLAGLQELTLGDLTLGGGSASINEFSTDPFFTADSDSIIPTQRAIKAYIASQIGGGGASLNVNSVTAGFIFINSNQITTTTGGTIQMRAKFEFRGGVTGLPLAFNFFLQ